MHSMPSRPFLNLTARAHEGQFRGGKFSLFPAPICDLSVNVPLLDKILGRPVKSSERKKEELTAATGVPVSA
jgi:hypothetical protein